MSLEISLAGFLCRVQDKTHHRSHSLQCDPVGDLYVGRFYQLFGWEVG